jgi:hypothetical protein
MIITPGVELSVSIETEANTDVTMTYSAVDGIYHPLEYSVQYSTSTGIKLKPFVFLQQNMARVTSVFIRYPCKVLLVDIPAAYCHKDLWRDKMIYEQ